MYAHVDNSFFYVFIIVIVCIEKKNNRKIFLSATLHYLRKAKAIYTYGKLKFKDA